MNILSFDSVTITINDQSVCQNLNLALDSQQVLGILGRNGVGKSTLLYTIMGFHHPDSGSISLLGSNIRKSPRSELARKLGILFQESANAMPATVLETALLGRHPHSDNLLWDKPEDIELTREILQQLGLDDLEDRQVNSLSGGEKQRLSIALLMNQAPQLYLLDEPSNHLDIDYQIKSLTLIRDKLRAGDAAMVMASHDINLTARFCDRILLLGEDGQFVCGPTSDVLNEETLSQAYRCQIRAVELDSRRYFFPA